MLSSYRSGGSWGCGSSADGRPPVTAIFLVCVCPIIIAARRGLWYGASLSAA